MFLCSKCQSISSVLLVGVWVLTVANNGGLPPSEALNFPLDKQFVQQGTHYSHIFIYHEGPGARQTHHIIKQRNNTPNQENHKHSSAWALWRQSLTTVRLHHRSLSSQSLNQNNQKTQHIPTQM